MGHRSHPLLLLDRLAVTIKKSVYYDVWCDDGRYCDPRAGKSFVGVNQATVIKMARELGWEVKASHAARCPDCVRKRR